MSEKVSITKSKLDSLANAIAAVGETSIPKTIAQMESAVLELTPDITSLTVNPTESQQVFNSDAVDGYLPVTVNGISSTYVGSGITRRSSSDLTVLDANVSAPAGYYASSASKSVQSGSVGTPTATKGTVSNHSVSVTPSVTSTTGYIIGGTKNGTPVTVSASELVSGTKSITSSGTTDVTNYASASVATGTVSPRASKGTVSNHAINIIPYADTTSGFIGTGAYSGTAVTVDVTELESGTKTITENGTGISVSGYSTVDVNVSGGGGGDNGNFEDPIRFFDYDGTLVASYTSVPSALPSLPSHSKLKNGVWNYTLQQITSSFNETGQCDIGANYETVSGKTEIDICLTDSSRLSPRLCISVDGTVVVDWGDGGSTNTITGSSLTLSRYANHDYSTTGEYTISIEVQSGSFAFYGGTSAGNNCFLCTQTSTNYDPARPYMGAVKELRVGPNCSFGKYACYLALFRAVSLPPVSFSFGEGAFYACDQLKALIIPYGTTTTARLIQGCTGLRVVVVPTSVTAFGSYFCMNTRLMRVCIPNTVTTINDNSFNAMKYISSFKIPSSVSTIRSKAFSNQTGILEYHFYSSTPPTLNATDVFASSLSTGRVIYVPTASVDTYKEDTNWSAYASYIQGE